MSSRRRRASHSPTPGSSSPTSRWITPAEVKIRFDTWFFLAPAPAGVQARVDGSEVVDARWYGPAAALAARERGDLFLVFPTIKHLQQLSAFASADELLSPRRRPRGTPGRAARAPPGRDRPDRAPRRAGLRRLSWSAAPLTRPASSGLGWRGACQCRTTDHSPASPRLPDNSPLGRPPRRECRTADHSPASPR